MSLVLIRSFFQGMPTVRMPKYELKAFLQAIERYRVVAIPMVPPVAVQLAKSELTKDYDLSSLKVGLIR